MASVRKCARGPYWEAYYTDREGRRRKRRLRVSERQRALSEARRIEAEAEFQWWLDRGEFREYAALGYTLEFTWRLFRDESGRRCSLSDFRSWCGAAGIADSFAEPPKRRPTSDYKPRPNPRYEYRGEWKTAREWADERGLQPETVRYRIKQGWPMERVLQPVEPKAVKRHAS